MLSYLEITYSSCCLIGLIGYDNLNSIQWLAFAGARRISTMEVKDNGMMGGIIERRDKKGNKYGETRR